MKRTYARNQFFSSRYKRLNVRKIKKGIIHIQSSQNNTIITVTDFEGQVVIWDSGGTSRFKGPQRGKPQAAQIATQRAIRFLMKQGMREGKIWIKGCGSGREAALKAAVRSGLKIISIRDVTPLPHNGCRPPKKRRIRRDQLYNNNSKSK